MSRNGHNPNDAIVARIVAGAIQADKPPPMAAKAVRRALPAAGEAPPPERQDLDPVAAAAADHADWVMLNQKKSRRARLERLAAERVGRHQEALVLALAREKTARGELLPLDMGDLDVRLRGFDYQANTEAEGYREYEIDDQPLVRFYSPEVAFDGDSMLVNLRYRIPT